METLEKIIHTVPASCQVSRYVRLLNDSAGSPRLLFLGNSVTWHAPKDDIGWAGDWGMAASSAENDYAHRVLSAVRERFPSASGMILQGAVWERNLECDCASEFAGAREFAADALIFTLCANTPADTFRAEAFVAGMERLLSYVSENSVSPIVPVATDFFGDPSKSAAIEAYAARHSATVVNLFDLGANPENRALGKFAHEGVANHPGDLGMQRIAERILEKLIPALEKR